MGVYSRARSANNSIPKTKDGGNSIIAEGGKGLRNNGSLPALLMACSFIF